MVADSAKWYQTFARVAPRLTRDDDYEVEEAKHQVAVTEAGVTKVEQILAIDNLYDNVNTMLVHHLNNALRAKELYTRDVQYVVTDGEVKIVDEFTGRVLDGRRYSEGLHQAIEAKEGVRIKEENQTLATITIQNYFKMYDKLSGMTGTAKTQLTEFEETYKISVVEIPTNRPMVRADQQDRSTSPRTPSGTRSPTTSSNATRTGSRSSSGRCRSRSPSACRACWGAAASPTTS